MNVIGYLRVSTDLQADQGFGLDVQEEQIRTWAKANGHRLVRIFRDEGVSGAIDDIEARDELPLALAYLRAGMADGLVMARLDRIARKLTIQELVLAMVWALGAKTFAIDMGGEVVEDDPDDPMRTAMRQMAGVWAQLDRAMTIKRLRDGRRAKEAKGGYAGGRPRYGWRAEGKALVENPEEQAVRARIVELADVGLSSRAIAELLTAEGVMARHGGPWTSSPVAKIMRQEREPVPA